jgi:hypothetical protein
MNKKINTPHINCRGISAFAALLSLGAIASSASASIVVAEYEFTAASTSSIDSDSLTTAGEYDATIYSSGSGISGSSESAYFFPDDTESSLANAISVGGYQSFTLDLETSGATISLESLYFDQEFWNTASSLTTSVSIFIGTSETDFDEVSDALATFTIDGADYTDGSTAVVEDQYIDLSGITELQDLTTNLEVRLYFYDNSTADNRTQRIDNIVLTASSVIPEPASLALLFSLASFGTTIFMRRGKRTA